MEITLNHIDSNDLKRLIRGDLTETAADDLLFHLETCDVCLQKADELWAQLPWGQAAVGHKLDGETAVRLQKRLSRQVSRSNLGGTVLRLGSKGFVGVITAVLRPLMHFSSPKTRKGDTRD